VKTLRVNDYDMAYVEIGQGPPLVCVHGSINDFRDWAMVMGPLSARNRLIVPSLRHYFPEAWDGKGGGFSMAQHVNDMITFIEGLRLGPVDLIGHSRGGHLSFRLALRRPELLRKLVLAEPGGTLDESLMPPGAAETNPAPAARDYVEEASEKIGAGDLEGGLRAFIDGINGSGAWDALPPAIRQTRIDNANTLLAQVNEGRQPYAKAEAEALSVPTLFVGGADTQGLLPIILNQLADNVPNAKKVMIPNAGHPMFRQQPAAFCEAVTSFLAE
jgi:esterase